MYGNPGIGTDRMKTTTIGTIKQAENWIQKTFTGRNTSVGDPVIVSPKIYMKYAVANISRKTRPSVVNINPCLLRPTKITLE
jgi:hypothetical protein